MKIISATLAVAALSGALAAQTSDNSDPVHHGKRLSEWFAEYSQTPAYETPATKAIEAIGSNAVPYLVRFLSPNATNSWTKRAAMAALDRVGDQAQSATAALVLCLKDRDPKVQADAAYSLARIGRGAKPAIPEVKAFLQTHRGDAYVGLAAVTALWRIDSEQTPSAVEALEAMLIANGRWEFDDHVLETLREIGAAARASIPTLEQGLREEQLADYWHAVAATIAAIDRAPAEVMDGEHGRRLPSGEYRYEPPLPGETLTLLLISNGRYWASKESKEKLRARENGTWSQKGEDLFLTRQSGNVRYNLRRFRIDERFPDTLRWLPSQAGARVGSGVIDFPTFTKVKSEQ